MPRAFLLLWAALGCTASAQHPLIEELLQALISLLVALSCTTESSFKGVLGSLGYNPLQLQQDAFGPGCRNCAIRTLIEAFKPLVNVSILLIIATFINL